MTCHWSIVRDTQYSFCITEIPECNIVYRSCSIMTIPLPQWRQPKSGCVVRSFQAFYLRPFFSTSKSVNSCGVLKGWPFLLHLFFASNRRLCGVVSESFWSITTCFILMMFDWESHHGGEECHSHVSGIRHIGRSIHSSDVIERHRACISILYIHPWILWDSWI